VYVCVLRALRRQEQLNTMTQEQNIAAHAATESAWQHTLLEHTLLVPAPVCSRDNGMSSAHARGSGGGGGGEGESSDARVLPSAHDAQIKRRLEFSSGAKGGVNLAAVDGGFGGCGGEIGLAAWGGGWFSPDSSLAPVSSLSPVMSQVKVDVAKHQMKTEEAQGLKTEEAQWLMKQCFQENNQSFEERQRNIKAEEAKREIKTEEGKRQISHSFHETLLQIQRERAGTDIGLADQGTGLERIQGTRLELMEGMGTETGSAHTPHHATAGGGGGGHDSGRSGPGTDAWQANGAAFNGPSLSLSSFSLCSSSRVPAPAPATAPGGGEGVGGGGVADRSRVTPSLGHEQGGALGDKSNGEMAAGWGRLVGRGGEGADSPGAGVVEIMREMMVKVAMEAERDRAERERERGMEREARAALELKVLMLDKLVVEVAQERAERKMQQEQECARRERERAEMAALEAKFQQALHALTLAGYGTHSQTCPLDSLRMPS
jgi:hypothetical protein